MVSQGPTENVQLLKGQTNLNFYVLSTLLASLSILIIISWLRRKDRILKGKGKGSKNGEGEPNQGGNYPPDWDNLPGLEAIPQPWTWDPTGIIGNAFEFLPFSSALKNAVTLSQKFGDVYKVTALNHTLVGVNSASVAQSLLRSSEAGHLIKAPEVYDPLKPMTTNGVLISTGKLWQQERRLLLKSQSFQNLKAYMPMLNRHFKQFVSELETLFRDGEGHPISDPIFSCFLKVVNEMITGFRTDEDDHDEFMKYNDNIKRWKECLPYRFLPPWILFTPLWNLHPLSRKFDKASEELLGFARRRLREFKWNRLQLEGSKKAEGEDVVENSAASTNQPEFRTVLDELVDGGLEDEQIVAEMNAMIFGGYETGATAIHFFLLSMALNPEIQKDCQKEIDELFEDPGTYTNGALTFEAVSGGLKLVERCILETLRLFPPVYVYTRKLGEPLKINSDGQDILLPIGTKMVTSPFLIHRKPEYFPDPERFDPDRFLPEECAKRHPYAFLPFSGGPRNCLGLKFAMLEMKTVAAYTLRHFFIKTNDRMDDIPLLPFYILTPAKDYTFQLIKRENII